jgi:rsbT co-antagonist protein RsbR
MGSPCGCYGMRGVDVFRADQIDRQENAMAAGGTTTTTTSRVAGVLKKYEKELLADWMGELKAAGAGADGRIGEAELRTQVVMESLLQRIVETGAEIAILDITGVPTVDTLVAQHLIKTVTAARLMGADCIISGIRPQIAQTIVHLGVDLQDVITKATLADAFAVALQRRNLRVTRASATGGDAPRTPLRR